MFKCVLIVFLYLHTQTNTAAHKNLVQNMVYRKYKDPYKISSCCNLPPSGIRGPSTYVFEGNRLKLYSGSSGSYTQKHRTTTTTRKPTTTQMKRKENLQNEEDPQLRSSELTEKVTALKVSSLLRNNLIRVFGYILHRRDMELNSQLYTSLYFILSTIRLNQVNILGIVPILEEIEFKTSNERFLKIFKAMETYLPPYLTCAAAFWTEAIKAGEVNLDRILKPYTNGPLKVDVMEGMNAEILSMIKLDGKIDNLKNEEKKMLYDFNVNIVQIIRYFKQHINDIQQIFVGALILHFPRSSIQPDLEESIQLLTEFLEQNDIAEWKKYVRDLNAAQAMDPYLIVNDILHKLIVNDHISVVIKESIQIILKNLRNRNPTAINPHYNSIANLVTLDEIKITYMLQYISTGAYPPEVVISGMRLIYYLQHSYIRPLTLLVYFNPYFYSSPTEILIALLDRLIKRQSDLPPEIIDSAGAVYSYLSFSFRYIALPAVMPDDFLNPNILFMSLRAPDIERRIVKSVDMIISMLQIPGLSYQKILLERHMYKCATPNFCFFEVLEFIRAYIPDRKLKSLITALFQSSCYAGKCPLQQPSKSNYTSLFPRELIPLNQNNTPPIGSTSTHVTTVQPISPPSEGPVFYPSTLKPTLATPWSTTALVDDAIDPRVTKIMPNNATEILNIVQNVASDSKDKVYIKKILNIIKSEEYSAEFNKMKKGTHTLFITGILVYLDKVLDKEDIDSAVRKYFNTFFVKLKKVENIIKVITSEKQPTRPILAKLIVAVPAPMDNETAIFQQLSLLLQKEELFNLIEDNLEKKHYKNIGTLLKAVLDQELKLEGKLNYEEIKAAKYYADKMQLYGFGQGKILWGVDINVISRKINIAQIMADALLFKNFQKINRHLFNSIILYLKANPPILENWDKWIYYPKCGDFTKALFNLLLNHGSLPASIRAAVQILTRFIIYATSVCKGPYW